MAFLEDKAKHVTAPVAPDPFSLDALIAWLEKQDAAREYDWYSCDNCMIAQYLRSVTDNFLSVGATTWIDTKGRAYTLPDFFSDVGCEGFSRSTFGRALDRARAIREAQ